MSCATSAHLTRRLRTGCWNGYQKVCTARGLLGMKGEGSEEVVRVLMEGGADPRAGQPNAIQSARMFNRVSLLDVLGAKEGEGMDAPMPIGPPM